MQAALKKLGALDTDERVQRYIDDQQRHTGQKLQHDFDCICTNCERRQVLGARRSRRSVPTTVFGSARGESVQSRTEQGVLNERKVTLYRRHPTNENSRRGESKLGRAAGLRPGRITLWSVLEAPKPTTVDTRHIVKSSPECLPCATAHSELVDAKRRKDSPCLRSSNEEDGWDTDEHSAYSNFLHHEANRVGETDRSHLNAAIQANSPPSCNPALDKERVDYLFDDFYSRNPAALANGWLALPHHRDDPAMQEKRAASPPIRGVVRALLRPNQPQLVGLLPSLRPTPK